MGILDRLLGRNAGGRGKHAVYAPRRGLFTQCVCVLLDTAVRIDAVGRALGKFRPREERPAAPGESGWVFAGPSIAVPFRPEVNGFILVDVVDRLWPDGMGNPKAEAVLFGGWSSGQFGPCTYSGSFARAVQHAYRDRAVAELAQRHRGFLRVRSTYALGADDDEIRPADYDPLAELRFVTDVALGTLGVRGATCVFNPNGELLLAGDDLAQMRDEDERGDATIRVDQWANVRMFRPTDLGPREWVFFDTVGLEQLEVRDHEGAVPSSERAGPIVPGLLHTMGGYDAKKRGVLGLGDTATDLDGVLWRAKAEGQALIEPPRPVLRWYPDAEEPPAPLLRRTLGG